MINRVILTGRLTSDVELRRTNDGTPYTLFTLAVNRRNQDQTDFISCVAWRQTAELMNQYLNKGSLIGVEGSLQVFTQQKDGQYDTRTNVQVSNITFLESRAQAQGRGNINFENNSSNNAVQNESQEMTFANENKFDQSETTPVSNQFESNKTESNSFAKASEIDAGDINLDDIKF